jgi:hypothetical protein
MPYGHAERTLATIQLLVAETTRLLNSENHLDPEQERRLREAAESASQRLAAAMTRALGAIPKLLGNPSEWTVYREDRARVCGSTW